MQGDEQGAFGGRGEDDAGRTDRRAVAGEETVLTRDGKPVARIAPPAVQTQQHKQMFHVNTWEA